MALGIFLQLYLQGLTQFHRVTMFTLPMETEFTVLGSSVLTIPIYRDELQVGVVNDVTLLFGGQTRVRRCINT